nr:hypothetical protein [Pandoravirus massiliensis]
MTRVTFLDFFRLCAQREYKESSVRSCLFRIGILFFCLVTRSKYFPDTQTGIGSSISIMKVTIPVHFGLLSLGRNSCPRHCRHGHRRSCGNPITTASTRRRWC